MKKVLLIPAGVALALGIPASALAHNATATAICTELTVSASNYTHGAHVVVTIDGNTQAGDIDTGVHSASLPWDHTIAHSWRVVITAPDWATFDRGGTVQPCVTTTEAPSTTAPPTTATTLPATTSTVTGSTIPADTSSTTSPDTSTSTTVPSSPPTTRPSTTSTTPSTKAPSTSSTTTSTAAVTTSSSLTPDESSSTTTSTPDTTTPTEQSSTTTILYAQSPPSPSTPNAQAGMLPQTGSERAHDLAWGAGLSLAAGITALAAARRKATP